MREARELADRKQDELAEKLAAEDPQGNWSQTKVSDVERGLRKWTWEVHQLVAQVQGRPLHWYIYPWGQIPSDDKGV